MALIKKAELIERIKAGAVLSSVNHWGSIPPSYFLDFRTSKVWQRVHAGAVNSLFKSKNLKQIKRNIGGSEWVWRDSDGS